MNIWSSLFVVSIAQGLFLVSLIAFKGSRNLLASRLIITLLVLMVITNFGYVVIHTELVNYIPQFFGIPFGMMFLFGPLFYLYARSLIDNTFYWKKMYWLHFIPYCVQLIINVPFLAADKTNWIEFISIFLSGDLPIRQTEKALFVIQDIHFFIYLFFAFRLIQSANNKYRNAQYIISLSSRIRWLRALAFCFVLFLATVFILLIVVFIQGKYIPVTNYTYTLITSGIIYFVAYRLVLNPDLISPDFNQKYRSYMQFVGDDGEKYMQKLGSLMSEEKLFTNPDLKLAMLAQHLELPPHQVSKLINEKFGKSFNDFVNEYRVKEFISRVKDPKYQSYSIYGVALDAGFNSKSSFNAAFKKITGKTPTEYKTPS